MFESKLGTEKERDIHIIEGARLIGQPRDRVKEKIKKRKEKNISITINTLKSYNSKTVKKR